MSRNGKALPLNELDRELAPWISVQEDLNQVVRWSVFLRRRPSVRRQTSTQHTLGLALMMKNVIGRSGLESSLDVGLLLSACIVHDIPEGVLRRDVLYNNKSQASDVAEYKAFLRLFKEHGWSTLSFQQAYLLQFCLKDYSRFPREAQVIMSDLSMTCRREAQFFDFVERYDYLVYAWEQYRQKKNVRVAMHVLGNQIPKLRALVEALPCLGMVWSPKLDRDMQTFVDQHEDQMKKPRRTKVSRSTK